MQARHNISLLRVAAAAVLALASLAAQADVASINQSGGFGFDQEVHSFNLDISSASDLRLWTTSSAAGLADPLLALFDRISGALLSLSDDVGGPYAGSTWADGYLLGTSGGNSIGSAWTVRGELTNAAPIPEPNTTALLLAGLATIAWLARRRG